MKRFFFFIMTGLILGCSKDDNSSTSSTSQQSPNVAGVNLPSADAGLYTVLSNAGSNTSVQNSAWFETPNSTKDVGKVSYQMGSTNTNLSMFFGNYTSAAFLPDTFNVTKWNVEGKNGFPALSVSDDQQIPSFNNLNSNVSSISSSASDFTISHSAAYGADYVVYTLVNLSNQLANKNFAASSVSSTSFKFTNADFKAFIQTNNGSKGIPFSVTAIKYKTITVSGKKVLLVKQYTSWGAVEVL